MSPTPIPSPTPSFTPSPTPEPKTITVCLPDEPDSLYLHGSDSLAAQHVWQAIYDGPVDNRNYAYQPVILTSLPSLANGSAAVETITVQAGDRVLAASGDVVELATGVMVKDANGQRVTFDDTPILMPRMVVTFTLHSNIYWSDGALLTADDSVFSFELAAGGSTARLGVSTELTEASPKSEASTPDSTKALAEVPLPSAGAGRFSMAAARHVIERTAGYRAVDVRTVVWSGIPGFLDRAYFLNFWHPLPRHAWGHLSAAELLSADVSTRQPLGWGPFVLREWVPGDHITAARNPIYFRAPEGLPRVDEVTFRFISDPTILAEELLAGRCNVVTHDTADAVQAARPPLHPPQWGEKRGEVELISTHDARWELLAFGISPAPGYGRPDFFEDVRVRQAVALCIDRQTVVNQLLGPSGRVLHSPLPPEHPLYAGDVLTTWGYAPAAGQALLATAGWYDEDDDGVREAHNVPGIADGTPFQVAYHTTGDPLRVQTAQLFQTYLAECGIQVSVETLPPEMLFAPGPEGVLFGRRFDLAQFSWRAAPDPLCDLFLSSQMPDAGGWDKPNIVGFLDNEYDTACLSALEALPGSEIYAAGHTETQRIFSKRLPILPLFQHPKVTLAHKSVIGLAPDPTQASELWNIEQLDLRP